MDLNTISNGLSTIKTRAENVGAKALDAVPAPVTSVAKDALSLSKDALTVAGRDATRVATGVSHLPGAIGTWGRLGNAARTGGRTLLPGQMPAYPTLDPAARAQAKADGAGLKARQAFLASDSAGKSLHEPVSIEVRGTKADLVAALQSQGWVRNNDRSPLNYIKQGLSVLTRYNRETGGPVSRMFLDGKLEAMAFSKNCDYNLARDHMRLYDRGVDPKTGEQVWAIAATRDVAASVTLPHPERHGILPWNWDFKTPGFGHETDHAIDGERDLIMHDLLASKQVSGWTAVDGARTGVSQKRQADGNWQVGKYTTDGQVYQVKLSAPATR